MPRSHPPETVAALVALVRGMVAEHGQAETARRLGVAQPTVSQLVRGKAAPGSVIVSALARHYPDEVAAALGLSRPVGPMASQTAARYPHVDEAIALRGARWSRDVQGRLRSLALCWYRDKSLGAWIDLGDELAAEAAAVGPAVLPPGFSVVEED